MRSRFSRPAFLGLALAAVPLVLAAQSVNASFTYSPHNPTLGQMVQFTDTTTPAPGSWAWNFGDPNSGTSNTSTVQNPTHLFSAVGTYQVTMTVPGANPVVQAVTVQSTTGTCQQGPGFLCLNGGRFQVNATWTKTDGTSAAGTAVTLTDDSGYFWFFDPANIEMVVKVLNGCSLTNAYWVFAAGLTNVQVDWQVVDMQTGVIYTQQNPQGVPFAPVQDTKAFPTSCP